MKLPRQNIPESQKTEEWHLETAIAILAISQNNQSYVSERQKDHENYLIIQGHFNPEEFTYVTDIGGMTSPARFVNHPIIMNKLDLLAGELVSQPLQYTVHVTNRNAVVRKLDQKCAVAAETILRPIRKEIEEVTGVPFEDEDVGEEVPEDVAKFMAHTFRDNKEQMVQVGLDYLVNKQDLKNVFKRGFYDIGVTSKEFYKIVLKNGDPFVKRLDPRSVIYDMHADVEDLKDAKFAGDINYLTINEIIETYNPTKEQVKWLEELEDQDSNWYNDQNASFTHFIYESGKQLKVCVSELQWKSIENMDYNVSENKYDPETPYYRLVSSDHKPKSNEKIVKKPMTQVRYAIKITDKLLKWGKVPNRVSFEDNYADTTLDYFGVIKSNFNGTTLSVVDCLKNINILYNECMFHISATMNRAGGKAVVYDVSQKPKGMELAEVIYHAKNSGLIPINTRQEGGQYPGSFNQFQQVDLTLSNGLTALFNLKMVLEDTADKLTGISAARSGINKSGDLVGVNERNVMQSSLITAPLFEMHYKVVGQVLNCLANKMKIAWGNEPRMISVFGDMGYQLFEIDPSIALDEYGLFVQNSGKEVQDKQMMIQLINQYSATGSIPPELAIEAAGAQSATELKGIMKDGLKAIGESQKAMREREVAAQEQLAQVEAKKLEIELQKTTIASQTSIQVENIKAENKIQVETMKAGHSADMQEATRKEKLDLQMLKDTNAGTKEPEVKPAKPDSKSKSQSKK